MPVRNGPGEQWTHGVYPLPLMRTLRGGPFIFPRLTMARFCTLNMGTETCPLSTSLPESNFPGLWAPESPLHMALTTAAIPTSSTLAVNLTYRKSSTYIITTSFKRHSFLTPNIPHSISYTIVSISYIILPYYNSSSLLPSPPKQCLAVHHSLFLLSSPLYKPFESV